MIKGFRHKGLKLFFDDNDGRKLRPDLLRRVRIVLTDLDQAVRVEDMNRPGNRLHRLKGDLEEFWSVTVTANWPVIFRFEDGDAYDINLVDYH